MAGSLLKDDRVTRYAPQQRARDPGISAPPPFSEIARRAGWTIARMLDGLTIHTVAPEERPKGEPAPS